ncbi:MAG: hypothetical protein H7Y59_10325 [Anaerolineales bacterium]|nr:hypothetical protein [Anaerolineales bacterium]
MKKYYSKQDLWSLFLICAFPLHFWTLLLAFRDVSWVAERTNFWDAIGVVSYGMIFAFFESLLFFLAASFCGLLISQWWGKDRRLAITSMLVLVLALWAILTQLVVLQSWDAPDVLLGFLVRSAHPLRNIYFIILFFIVPSVVLPILIIYKNDKILRIILDMVDRVSLLTIVYLLVDFMALIIVLIRNVG